MRSTAGFACVLLVIAGCSAPVGSPPDPTTTSPPDGPTRGVLPDGTVYDVVLEPAVYEDVTDVSAAVVLEDGLAEVVFEYGDGEWNARAGADPLPTSTHLGLPVVDLSPPLQWADDEQAPMEVTYETFAVRRGCSEAAVACNPTQAVQAVPLDEISPDAPPWSAHQATVLSYALRPPSNPFYMDPGPLAGRSGHDLLWTGQEMIVWGGNAPPRVEGAAFDPEVDSWRMLPPAPLEDGQATRAVWAGRRMIVVSEETTLAYEPHHNSWTSIAQGAVPPSEPGAMVWTGEEVVFWSEEGIQRLTDGTWTDMGGSGREQGVLRVMDGRLFAVGPQDCDERVAREWTGERWEVAAPLEVSRGCPLTNQTAVVDGQVVTWQDHDHPTLVHDLADDHREEVDPIPLSSIDRPSGPLVLGDRLLVTRGPEGAIFDPASSEWQPVDLPGHGTDATMVWTGEEILMWDRCCYEPNDVDAWRAGLPSMDR